MQLKVVTENGNEFEVPPPGAGLSTLTSAVPPLATSVSLICAVSCVGLTKVVGRGLPLNSTTAPGTKFDPFAVSVNVGSPATAEPGLRLDSVGTGFWIELIESVSPFEVPPPGAGLATVTVAVPTFATSAALSWANTCE